MSTLTKLAFDKTIAEMHTSNRIHQQPPRTRMELGNESPSLRSSNSGIYFNNNDASNSDSDDSGSNGSFGSYGSNRHSFISISEENNSPSSPIVGMGVSYAFMSSARGSRILQEEELARLSDSPLDPIAENPTNPQISAINIERNATVRSPSLGKDKRMEYMTKLKNELIQGNTFAHPATPPPMPPSSPPDDEAWNSKRIHRHSFALSQSLDGVDEKLKDKEKDKAKLKKEEKERLKEEKLRKKLEKKETKKTKAVTDPPNIASAENSRIMQQILGSIRPRASLSQRGGSAELDEQLRRPIDSSQKENVLRRSTSFGKADDLDTMDESTWKNRPKYEKILGTPVPDMDFLSNPSEDRPSWRKTKFMKHVVSDPFPVAPSLLPPPPPPPTLSEEESTPSPPLSPTVPLASTSAPTTSTVTAPGTTLNSSSAPAAASEDPEPKQRRKPKLEQILGIDINNLDVHNTSVEMDVDEEEIVFSDVREQNGRRQVKGATLKKLVDRLTCESLSDTTFLLQFIITYRSFTNPHELLELLKARYTSAIEIGPDVTDAEKEELTKKQLIVRLRVYNVVRQWIDKQWMDFLEDTTLVEKMLSFAPLLNEVVSSKASGATIDKLIEKKMAEGEKQRKFMFSMNPPQPYIPTVPKDKWKLIDLHSEEIARQMTLMEYSLFKVIKPWEYLCWNTKMKQTKSANILAMVNKFNVMSKWVQMEVLHSDTPKQRAVIIGKFLEICENLKALKNYNGIMEILSGLNASAVHRLKLSWACLSAKQNDTFQEFNTFTTGHNFKNLRTALHTLQPPCIPYLGMYLTDLTFINDGIPQYLPDTCYINFDKCRKISASVIEIMQYQQTPFCLQPVDDIQVYLNELENKHKETEEEIYKLSLALEARQ